MKNKLFTLFILALHLNFARAAEGQTLFEFFGFSSDENQVESVLDNYLKTAEQVSSLVSVMAQEDVSTKYVDRVMVWLNNTIEDLRAESVNKVSAQESLDRLHANHLNDLIAEYGVQEEVEEERAGSSVFSIGDWIAGAPDHIERAVKQGASNS